MSGEIATVQAVAPYEGTDSIGIAINKRLLRLKPSQQYLL